MKRSKARSRTLQRDSFDSTVLSTPTTVHPGDFYDSEAL